MVNTGAEIIPCLGLGGLLLGQSWQELPFEQEWRETGSIVRGSLAQGAVEAVGDLEHDRIIGLIAQSGYSGRLANGIGLGTSLEEARRLAPELRWHDLDLGLYEPERLGYLLRPDDAEKVESVLVCDFAHDYWTFARPLLREEDVQ